MTFINFTADYSTGEKRLGRNPRWKRGPWGKKSDKTFVRVRPSKRKWLAEQRAAEKRAQRSFDSDKNKPRPKNDKNPTRGARRLLPA